MRSLFLESMTDRGYKAGHFLHFSSFGTNVQTFHIFPAPITSSLRCSGIFEFKDLTHRESVLLLVC